VTSETTPNPRALLEVRHVTRQFGGVAAVNDVSLEVFTGEAVGLVGSNGAGKTTLFKLIAGELALTKGEILFNGAALPARQDARSRAGIGRTFQIVELFGGLSVLDHLLVSLQAHDRRQGPIRDLLHGGETLPAERQRCEEILELCDLSAVADSPATTLSLGKRRAVELARALVSRPKLLLADEPSSGLDLDESEELIRIIANVRRETGLTVLLIDHDLVTIEAVSDRVIAMDAGQVIAAGTFQEVTTNEAVRTSWLGSAL
jgi:branched-chain amino acid transport system ATP-binding protein